MIHGTGVHCARSGSHWARAGTTLVRSKTIIMIVMALVFGAGAIFAGQRWLDRQSNERLRAMQLPAPQAVPTQTVVVAALPLRFGTEITKQHLREVAWPEGAAPKGGFAKIDEILDGKTRRVSLTAIEENEPILRTKITGPGQRASLAALIDPGMKAVTVRVNDVNGVAGFVLPGERVDVLLTRSLEKNDGYADVLLQNVKVLAVDQIADDRADKPAVVKAVTVEVTTEQAQQLTLATNFGSLSLVLRSAGVADLEATRRVAVPDLGREANAPAPPVPASAPASPPVAQAPAPPPPRTTTVIGVTRDGTKREEYVVSLERKGAGDEITTSSTSPRRSKAGVGRQ